MKNPIKALLACTSAILMMFALSSFTFNSKLVSSGEDEGFQAPQGQIGFYLPDEDPGLEGQEGQDTSEFEGPFGGAFGSDGAVGYDEYADGGLDFAQSHEIEPADTPLERAQNCVGRIPYEWGGCSPMGCDCTGFVSYCVCGKFARIGTTFTFLAWPQTTDPQPGDVCVSVNDCGIYTGGGSMIHCSTPGSFVTYGPISRGMIFVRPPEMW